MGYGEISLTAMLHELQAGGVRGKGLACDDSFRNFDTLMTGTNKNV